MIAPPGASAQGSRTLDIIFLVERLESLIANGRSLPLTRNVVVDREAALNLIDELRSAVPEEVRAAKRISHDREQILERTQDEAEQIRARAQEQAAWLIDERGLTEAAEAESQRLVLEAQNEAAAIRNGADEYASSVLADLAGEVDQTRRNIEAGISVLEQRRAAYEASLAAAPGPAAVDAQSAAGYQDHDEDAYGRR